MTPSDTIRIQHEGFPDGLVINKEDFNPKEHVEFGEGLKPITEMTVAELRAFAKEHGITLGADVTTKDAILSTIQAADFKLNTPEENGPEA